MPLKRTQPAEDILRRNPDEQAEVIQTLELYTEGLDEFVDFSTHLLLWEYQKHDLKEARLPAISLFRRVLEVTDAISVLLKSSAVDPCEILLRTLFETTLSLEYLLEEDTDRRGMCYLYDSRAEQVAYLKRFDPKSSNYKAFKEDFKRSHVFKEIPEFTADMRNEIARINAWLNDPQRANVQQEYNRVRAKGVDAKQWYSPFSDLTNKNSKGEGTLLRRVDDLAKHLNKFDLYVILYKQWSKTVHGSDAVTGIFSSQDQDLHMISLRQPMRAHAVANITLRIINEVVLSLDSYNRRQRNKEYRNIMGEFIWWRKAYQINYAVPIMRNALLFENL